MAAITDEQLREEVERIVLAFTLTLVDHERMRGERVEVCKTS